MYKTLQILKIIGLIVSILGFMVSVVLTINLAVQVFGTTGNERIWVVLGATVGIVWNLAEIGFFIRYAIYGDMTALAFGCIFGLISVSASVGALQMSLERGAMQSIEFKQQLAEIESIKSQIKSAQSTAANQRKINYITRSAATLARATPLFGQLRNAQQRLSLIKDKGAGINAALYRAYARLLGVNNIDYVAIFLNLIFSLLIEFCFFQYTLYQVNEARLDTDIQQGKKQKTLKVFRKTGTENSNKIGFQFDKNVPETVSENVFSSNRETVHNVSNFDSLISRHSGSVNGFDNENRSRKTVNVYGFGNGNDKADLTKLKSIAKRFKKEYGKTDPFILYIWDNWANFSHKKRSFGNVSKLVGKVYPGDKDSVSKTYCWRVIKQERG